MTSGPIEWGAHDPDLVERLLSVMLLQDRPRAWRRERSRGDGGVDVGDAMKDGYEVFQIKSFTGSLTSRRKNDIAKSLKSALAGGALDGPIVAWRLLLPMDPSKEAEKWFRDLTAGAPFECAWLGKSRVDLLASKHPHVVDYYLRDGRARVEQRYRDLLRMRDIIESAEVGPRPVEMVGGLRHLLEGLNRDDPHYAYAFEASHDPPPIEGEMQRPGLVMTKTECIEGRGCVTVRVFARHRHAIEERPVTISFNVDAGSDAHHQLQRSLDFGGTAELAEGSVTGLTVTAPGGLATENQTAGLRVWGHPEAGFVPFILTFAVVDEDGDELARTTVAVTDRRAGLRGRELTCVESGGAFSLTMQVANPPFDTGPPVSLSHWRFHYWGKPAVKVRDGVGVLAHLSEPNSLIVSLEPGEKHMMTLGMTGDGAPVPDDVYTFVADLATIQHHSNVPLIVPAMIVRGDVRRVRRAAQLTAGTIIDGTWEHAEAIVDAAAAESFVGTLEAPHALAMVIPLELHVGDQKVVLGKQLVRFASARIADPSAARGAATTAGSPDAEVPIALVPGHDADLEIMWTDENSLSGSDMGVDRGAV